MNGNTIFAPFSFIVALSCSLAHGAGPLDPKGAVHVPIGIANAVDTLKTFVEAEGSFSPGFATYGVYFWLYDPDARKLAAPTMDGAGCRRGLSATGYLIPWTRWESAGISVKTEVCQAVCKTAAGDLQIVAARARLTNRASRPRPVALYVALRPLGPAGGPVEELAVSPSGDALLVSRHAAIVAETAPSAAGVMAEDKVGEMALAGKLPQGREASSASGDCSGALRFDLELAPGESKVVGLICPVRAGRRAVGHDWDGTSDWAQFDLARPDPPAGGTLQPDPELSFYRKLKTEALFQQARQYWNNLVGRVTIRLPDPRWAECFAAIVGHAAMEMNGGAPDVAVVNYNVFNRDGVYVANILQKSGNLELAAQAIDYFLAHPFNGRTRVEADNPGQVLWAMGEHWRFSRDEAWLRRVYPAAAKIAAMVRFYRTTPGPHYVKATSLEFGDSLPPDKPRQRPAHRRQVLRPGSCDGHHSEYTEAYDIAGLRAAAMLAEAAGRRSDAIQWERLARQLMAAYDRRFGDKLPTGYGSYCVLWPCGLYPLSQGKAHAQFRNNGAGRPGGWRYFALAKAHQGLLAGNRDAGFGTIANHLSHPQLHRWYVFDEGGRSGSGGWGFARTNWNGSVAMPHGWAIAEMWLLLRDCLAFEDGGRLRLLPGVPPEWFTADEAMVVKDLPTYFGSCSFTFAPDSQGATLRLTGDAAPPGGFLLAVPRSLKAAGEVRGKPIPRLSDGSFPLPPDTGKVRLHWSNSPRSG